MEKLKAASFKYFISDGYIARGGDVQDVLVSIGEAHFIGSFGLRHLESLMHLNVKWI